MAGKVSGAHSRLLLWFNLIDFLTDVLKQIFNVFCVSNLEFERCLRAGVCPPAVSVARWSYLYFQGEMERECRSPAGLAMLLIDFSNLLSWWWISSSPIHRVLSAHKGWFPKRSSEPREICKTGEGKKKKKQRQERSPNVKSPPSSVCQYYRLQEGPHLYRVRFVWQAAPLEPLIYTCGCRRNWGISGQRVSQQHPPTFRWRAEVRNQKNFTHQIEQQRGTMIDLLEK